MIPHDKLEVRFWRASQMAQTIDALRNAGYTVKDSPNYVVTTNDQEVLRAMRNARGMYLVRYNRDLFASDGGCFNVYKKELAV